ncbi:acetate--CoA ligase [ADP-forming] I subunit beta [Nanobdella aerobiophila]|uniref:Acetate--CoA ligase [ADP-forming] I subunit beta n=1 Tax=Nanobdella aerobiophila TaxID=2586965 RepID=A0A915SY57_9ARCH|nr:acetate--CoA ligase family protein [Nanobdella aerobiophila]BBL45560.1 acetate--CoA ligase [ADP-forming] I subunit beta [Nanobdella aerobiophila]
MLSEGFELLEKNGIKVPEFWTNNIPIHVKFPVVIKADINHKTDKNAVKLNVYDYKELELYYNKFKKEFQKDVIIQEQIIGDYIEIILGIKKDITFGDIVLIGLGGIYTELFKDFIILSFPFDINMLKERLKDLKYYRILEGYRNKKGINMDILYENINKLYSIFKDKNFNELEVNPLLINEKEAYAVDIRFF